MRQGSSALPVSMVHIDMKKVLVLWFEQVHVDIHQKPKVEVKTRDEAIEKKRRETKFQYKLEFNNE